ncbi:ABC transporter ATP-binding protein [Candidatus Korarchaeum cryptofilum]|jgi:branched-chain amino acid transport system ATP-binding protein|uniref:Probable branched-chain amino acid transport ATP-binding protein LivG n=1 Tax=Candidatus Korarchaeum cryptofilum TaxID=498846 RepID=A0A3R9QQV0_9CREN|nr:ABC transporter ATP-binding protein [Candidatus Korarchaeum cryptofilum]RSN67228.1 ABC transporter ATP-binding protein [Candidatus Korarchaeum cryptofilum]TDA42300.1 MAG: ABC transporter ATP-binding protein [Candidatus Korarchaeota archaeon]
MDASDIILETKNVVKKFGELRAVDGVSISVERERITLLIGPNGSGKTTLVNVISGYYKPDAGRVYFEGRDITGLPPHEIYRLKLVRSFQIPAPFARMSVLENLLIASRDHPGESFFSHLLRRRWLSYDRRLIDKAYEVLEMLGISDIWMRRAEELSAAQLKLLEIGRALMSDADLIILDEPIAGVNPTSAHEIFSHLTELKNKYNKTLLIIEHRLDIALPYADHVFVLNEGKLIYSGSPAEVTKDERVRAVYIGE